MLELHFNQLLSSKAYFKVCSEVQKIWLPRKSLLDTNVPNDNGIFLQKNDHDRNEI